MNIDKENEHDYILSKRLRKVATILALTIKSVELVRCHFFICKE